MILFYPDHHYDENFRGLLFPLLKPFIKKSKITDLDRVAMYGVSSTDYQFTESMKDADVLILPMAWNYYATTQQMEMAYEFIDEAIQLDKEVLSWNAGDYGVKIREFSKLTVFRMGGYTSKQQLGHQGFPVIINDYFINQDFNDYSLPINQEGKPIVGFCGQANTSIFNSYRDIIKILFRNVRFYLGLTANEPQVLLSSTALRAKLLAGIKKNNNIQSNFILRNQYRAGVKSSQEKERTTKEFYQNMIESHYILCVRGAGNFSVRFYETLMMGRIPVYVHTDGFMPLSNKIDWRKHVVWVDEKEQHRVDEIILNFHRNISEKQLHEMCLANRNLWKEYLTLNGFFKSYFH